MADLAMLALSLIAVAAVFLALHTEEDGGEKSEAGEIDRIRRDKVRMKRGAQLR